MKKLFYMMQSLAALTLLSGTNPVFAEMTELEQRYITLRDHYRIEIRIKENNHESYDKLIKEDKKAMAELTTLMKSMLSPLNLRGVADSAELIPESFQSGIGDDALDSLVFRSKDRRGSRYQLKTC